MENEKNNRLIPLPSLPPDFLLIACLTAAAIFLGLGIFLRAAPWVLNLSFVAAVLLAGYDLVFDAVMRFIRERSLDEKLLLLVAVIGVFLIGKAAEAAAAILLFRVGEFTQEKLAERSTNSAEGLLDQRPDTVSAVVNGAIVCKTAGKIKVGDVISVAPGERLALDGIVVSGASTLNVSAVTGSAEPIPVSYGTKVLSGSVNLNGALNIRVTAEFDNSTVSRLIEIIEKAESKKSKPEKAVKQYVRVFTPAVVGAAIIAGILVPLIGGLEYGPWLHRAFGLLAVSCLYALVISIPLTYFMGICGALRNGILYKGASVVDALASTTSVVFGKTGILTTGRYQVTEIHTKGISEERLLMLAAYAEARSSHPLARAIVAKAGIEPDSTKINDYREFPGKGTEAEIGGVTVTAGNELLMAELGITPDISQNESSAVYIAVNGKYTGRILLNDALKPSAKKAVKELRDIGIDRVAIFTGDKTEVAGSVAGELGVQEYYAECLPDDKVRRLAGLNDMQLPGDMLVYVGDAQTDGRALKTADIGVSLGGLGTEEAVEAADLIIMTEEPAKITAAIKLARETNQIVRQNILLSLIFKGVILLVILIFAAPIWLAVFADAAAAVAAILNAGRAFGMHRRDIRKALQASSNSAISDEAGNDNTEDYNTDK